MRLRITPTMTARLTDHVWEIEELAGLMEAREQAPVAARAPKRRKYERRAEYCEP